MENQETKLFPYVGNIAIRLKPEFSEQIDNYYEAITGTSEPPASPKDFLEKTVNYAVERFKTAKPRKQDIEEIERLQAVNRSLQAQLQAAEDYTKETISSLETEKEKHQEEIRALEALINQKELKHNQIIIEFNDFQKELIEKYLENDVFKNRIAKANEKSNGLFALISTENKAENIFNLLYDMLLFHSSGSQVRLFNISQIEQAYQKFLDKTSQNQTAA